ncbi:TPA: DUF6615 family protein [Vibrio parahaemolyticus]|nr:DUF6615 family protein [Vibrio parahaemolyticus]AYF15539.1 hypothetical protein FORC72_1808 [Vibrio parahaemolyticus]ELA9868133.1 hypothetical protein [Vibrio parahaemolyticus]ELC3210337.1 hypothetical protein [Vibrio parahaemolyticus]ELI5382298.1 hypothetical protein [Vibrio parahaemolyticus]MBM5180174.1 hypothetical protein [Vibrio parahaemolyticus]
MKNIFKFGSVCTWELLRKSKKYKSRIGEETITELLQLFLSHHHSRIAIKSFSKYQESQNGADWDWWFISPRKRKYLGVRVQAKTISPDTEEYKVLHYISGKQPQASKLLRSSVKDSMVPLYALYTYWDVTPTLSYTGEDKEHFGISLVTLDNIMKLKTSKRWKGEKETLKRISPDLVPLYKLLDISNTNKSLPENVFDNLKSELNPRKGMFSRTLRRPGVVDELPRNIMMLLESNGDLLDVNYDELLDAGRITLFVDTEN